ncbi:MAG: tyrosine protein phosphatase [Streptococcaceae bacterium]|jgi:protein-tyrosine phosphatase|nr:tyrosine protein phosphatase [Streptococcaceae bacterium]
MREIVDLHCHLLPGLDDGPPGPELTLEMLKKFAAEGVVQINASPHLDPTFHTSPQAVFEKVNLVNQMCADNQLPIEVLPSQEVHIFGELIEAYQAGYLLTVANRTNYLLLEFDSNDVPLYAENLIYEMRIEGLTPIIVHPERNLDIMRNPEKLIGFVNQGALTQVTASCVTGSFGSKFKENADTLFKMNLVHTIASDAHNVTSRASKMGRAFDVIAEKYGDDLAWQLNQNAVAIVNNQSVEVWEPRELRRRKLFGLF